jgi:cation diffusion facilitator CzcD-associated flavoprotein CzcO
MSDAAGTGADDGFAGEDYDVVVIGAGFGGLYALHRMIGLGLRTTCLESGEGPGGTWYWNRYPGARVDVESLVYSYSFDDDLQQEWHWPEHFSPQPDIEAYAKHVVDRFGLAEYINFSTTVVALEYDETRCRWQVRTNAGAVISAHYVIAATGSLSTANVPAIAGAESFAGSSFHTARWPAEGVDLRGRRVGVIGTGSTGIQLIPMIAEQAQHLTVFQRTANFSIPSRNRALDPDYEREYKADYPQRRRKLWASKSGTALDPIVPPSALAVDDAEREKILMQAWKSRSGFNFQRAFSDVLTDIDANDLVAEFVRARIREIVRDPDVAEALCPSSHPLGTKRLCLESGYYETYNRDNVSLVDLRATPIVRMTPTGVATTAGEHQVDVLVYATGFDAMTGALTSIDIKGVGGRALVDKWADGPTTYLGFMASGFPNLFMIHGPGSPSVLAQMIMAGEWQVDWVVDLITYMSDHEYRCVDATPEAESAWAREVDAAADRTLYKRAESWYNGANIEGKPRMFMLYVDGFPAYCLRCTEVSRRGYEGFVLSS